MCRDLKGVGESSCGCLGEGLPKQTEGQIQKPWGRKEPGVWKNSSGLKRLVGWNGVREGRWKEMRIER